MRSPAGGRTAGKCVHLITDIGRVDVPVPAGKYVLNVSGRGFVNYGWPGSTTPGDEWRLRFWPDNGAARRPAKQWDMPGCGVPGNIPTPDRVADVGEPEWVTAWADDGSATMVRPSDLRAQAVARERAVWGGGEPLTELNDVGIAPLAGYDRPLVDAIIAMDEARQRRVARWVTRRVFEFAGLAELGWVAPALRALDEGAPPPPPFDSLNNAFAHLHAEESGTFEWTPEMGSIVVVDRDEGSPFDHGNVHRPSFAIPAFFGAIRSDPLRAAFESLIHASATYGAAAPSLHNALRAEFGIPRVNSSS